MITLYDTPIRTMLSYYDVVTKGRGSHPIILGKVTVGKEVIIETGMLDGDYLLVTRSVTVIK